LCPKSQKKSLGWNWFFWGKEKKRKEEKGTSILVEPIDERLCVVLNVCGSNRAEKRIEWKELK
jgi:hypothetical protein